MLLAFGITVSLCTLAVCSGSLPHQGFIHSAILDHDAAFHMLWTPMEDKIIIEIQVATTGYAGLGFSPSGGMTGADMVIGWVDELGKVELYDLYGIGNTKPRIDSSQDYTLLGGFQNDTHTVLRFSRLWLTCDEAHDLQLTGDTTRVIWAFNDIDPSDLSKGVRPYHARNRGTKSLYLQVPKINDALNEDLQYWDVQGPNIELPENVETLYWCRIVKVPNLKKKNHVVGITPIIQPVSNYKYVHHMVLYQCHTDNSELVFEKFLVAKGTQCHTANMPLSWKKCQTVLTAWAAGSEGSFLPDHVGFPLGEQHGGADYFMLEIHYDNQFLDNGIVDTSGLRIYHTDHLRKHDAGMIMTGVDVNPFHIIPPGVKEWTSVGHCSSDCTKAGFPSTGINAIEGLLHTHFLGKRIHLRHIRDGKEMPPILKDDTYDFNYQQERSVHPEVKILPGDSLITECHVDSTSRKNATFGGFSTKDEMCIVFLAYYPKIDLSRCISSPTMETLLQPFGIHGFYPQPQGKDDVLNKTETEKLQQLIMLENQQLEAMLENSSFNATEISLGKFLKKFVVNAPPELSNVSWFDILNDEQTWSSDRLSTFQRAVKMGEYNNKCRKLDQSRIIGIDSRTYPNFEPYVPPKPKCNNVLENTSPITSNVEDIPVHN